MAELGWERGSTYCSRALGRVAPVGRSGGDEFDGMMRFELPVGVGLDSWSACGECMRAWLAGEGGSG